MQQYLTLFFSTFCCSLLLLTHAGQGGPRGLPVTEPESWAHPGDRVVSEPASISNPGSELVLALYAFRHKIVHVFGMHLGVQAQHPSKIVRWH